MKFPESNSSTLDLFKILDMGRWAPSGDNEQPWLFEITGEETVRVYLNFNPKNPYEFNNGQPILMAAGGLIETMRIYATTLARDCIIKNASYNNSGQYMIDLEFPKNDEIQPLLLAEYIIPRSVNRNSYHTWDISKLIVSILENSIGDEFKIKWHSSWGDKIKNTYINMCAANIRLKTPEMHDIHVKIIDWNKGDSINKIPISAINIDKLLQRIMKWVMKNKNRTLFMNKFMGGTILPIIEMDLIPNLLCARHFTIYYDGNIKNVDNREALLLRAGAAFQRFWLAATQCGLVLQPTFAPLAFAHHTLQNCAFTTDKTMINKAKKILNMVKKIWPVSVPMVFMIGRIGYPKKQRHVPYRSTRKPLSELLINKIH